MASRDATQPGIRRLDNARNGTHGWAVRVQRRRQVVTRFFADGAQGGNARAFAAAPAHRAQLRRDCPAFQRHEVANILRKNHPSGVPGVCHGGGYWLAFWPAARGKRKQAKFSIARYGEEQAFALAVAARQRALEALTEPYPRVVKGAPRQRPAVTPVRVPDPRIQRVALLRYRLRVEFHDERVIAVPLAWFPQLLKASPAERQHWALTDAGTRIVWARLGLTITAAELLMS